MTTGQTQSAEEDRVMQSKGQKQPLNVLSIVKPCGFLPVYRTTVRPMRPLCWHSGGLAQRAKAKIMVVRKKVELGSTFDAVSELSAHHFRPD